MGDLVFKCLLVGFQEVVTDVCCIDFKIFWTIWVTISFLVKVDREAGFDHESCQLEVICDIAEAVEDLLDVGCSSLLVYVLHHGCWMRGTVHELGKIFNLILY